LATFADVPDAPAAALTAFGAFAVVDSAWVWSLRAKEDPVPSAFVVAVVSVVVGAAVGTLWT
jgi:hypothetical protein